MRKFITTLIAAVLVLGIAVMPAIADWVEADGHKMHFPQLPDEAGWDVNATNPIVLADDWECSETGWVKDIHFWGSWMHGIEGQIISFNLSIHADIPADPPATPYSRPGETLWEIEVYEPDFIVVPIQASALEGWYDPSNGMWFENDHDQYFQYNVFLNDADWFPQDAGTVYWLNVSATIAEPAVTQWGWKSTRNHFLDDAVWALWGQLNWIDLWEPPEFMQSLDLSFVITGEPDELIGACCYPDPVHGVSSLCIETTQSDCINNYLGIYQGDGTVCAGLEACCLPDGSCIDADALCCVNELGGVPQGPGTSCSVPEACCLPDGTCIDVDPLCCDDMGGTQSPIGAPSCLGDADLNGIDDACEQPIMGACCWPDGTCTMETPADCINNGGDYKGDGTSCLGDINGNGIDDICEELWPGHKMHYPQLPDEAGWDVYATSGPNLAVDLADDWQCSETGWVKDIHFWGSWKHGNEAPILFFGFRIWSDIPASQSPTGYSMPGDILWERVLTPDMQAIDPPTMEGWYNPVIPEVIPNDHQAYYRYDLILDSLDWFWQEEGNIYWLSIICVHMGPTDVEWGWKSSKYHFMDDAVWGLEGEFGWVDIWEPPDYEISLDLAFVITAGAEPTGACCYENVAGEYALCTETTQDNCVNVLGGVYEGDGTVCTGMEACCLPGGACIDADPICCLNELGGVPQGPGSSCTAPEACCLSDGSCIDVDPVCCDDMGGTPQGLGTSCSANTVACCLTDGSCVDVDPLCCDDLGGTVSPFSSVCLGDGNGNTIDDACEDGGACCWPDGTCTMETADYCNNNGGDYKGDGTSCLGDINGNGTDDICEDLWPGHKMHFPQLPDETGWDVFATADPNLTVNLADDWRCTETGWVKDLHWWGSWKGGIEAPILVFAVRIWSDIPADQSPTGYSMPGEMLWERAPSPNGQAITSPTPEGWYNPAINEVIPNDHNVYYRYDVLLDSLDWFWQEEGTIYWLSIICVHMGSSDRQWGWKSSQYHFMDDAVWGLEADWNWVDIWEPPDYEVSLDLAFVITSGVEPTGACCYENPAGEYALCTETTQDSCVNILGGVYEGDGTECAGMQACCLSSGVCIDADSICCVNELGGVPQGPGTTCGSVQACCMSDGSCQNMDSVCCLALGGVPQGTGTSCSVNTIACCLTDGSCVNADPLCCDDLGGFISPWSNVCLGDGDMNGIDDACEEQLGACCWTDGSCTMETQDDCITNGGDYKGDGTNCLGDSNGNGIDDICENLWPGHKMHYPQLPDEAGWDVLAMSLPQYAVNLADDWRCSETGWVKDIHFWGSWKGGIPGSVLGFALRIYDDIPASQSPAGYSMPGELLYETFADPAATSITAPTFEGWYDPVTALVIPNDHRTYYRYDVYLDSINWFWQEVGNIYWLSIICVPLSPEQYQWGWKSSKMHFMDDAVWGLENEWNWIDLWEPPDFDTSMDLAFVITDGTCDCIPGDANGDGSVNVGDAVYLIAYVFSGGLPPTPYPLCSGDANCDCQVNVGDAVYIISYVFQSGPPPCDCPTWLSICGPPLRK